MDGPFPASPPILSPHHASSFATFPAAPLLIRPHLDCSPSTWTQNSTVGLENVAIINSITKEQLMPSGVIQCDLYNLTDVHSQQGSTSQEKAFSGTDQVVSSKALHDACKFLWLATSNFKLKPNSCLHPALSIHHTAV